MMLRILLLLTILFVVSPTAIHAQGLEDLGKDDLIQAVSSVGQVKKAIEKSLARLAQCATGGCIDDWGHQICELVGALDIQTNGAIIGLMRDVGVTGMPISEKDLELMKLILQQCKPTNSGYWIYGSILHVIYLPSQEADTKIRSMLGKGSERDDAKSENKKPK